MLYAIIVADVLLFVLASLSIQAARERDGKSLSQKKFYRRSIAKQRKELWGAEFQRFQRKALRDEMQSHYDRTNEQHQVDLAKLNELASVPAEKQDAKQIEQLTKAIEIQKPDVAFLKEQLDAINAEIDDPANPQSYQQQVEAQRSLIAQLKSFSKRI